MTWKYNVGAGDKWRRLRNVLVSAAFHPCVVSRWSCRQIVKRRFWRRFWLLVPEYGGGVVWPS